MTQKEYRLGFLILRAVVTLIFVAALLLGLRLAGLTVAENNAPHEVAEEIAETSERE